MFNYSFILARIICIKSDVSFDLGAPYVVLTF